MRVDWEKTEEQILAPWASKSKNSKGRLHPEKECELRTAYQRDPDRIIHSKAFRRLKHKTQVFLVDTGDHYRMRLTHTLEVSQIARTIARALRLNEDLTEAIALGHDLGHTPFGPAGERSLAQLWPNFYHNEQGLRVVDYLEKEGKGLNLTKEVRDGILNHRGSGSPNTLEGSIVQLSDKIAYINHDIDDALRAGIISNEQLPKEAAKFLGNTHGERIESMVMDIINNCDGKQKVAMTTQCYDAMHEMRTFLFAAVYMRDEAKKQEEKLCEIIHELYSFYIKNPDQMPELYRSEEASRGVCDFIAGMTDNFAIDDHKRIQSLK